MNRVTFTLSILAALALALGCAAPQSPAELEALKKENERLKSQLAELKAQPAPSPEAAPTLPASLDALFPPQAEQPVFLGAMHGMDMAFNGMIVDFFEQDTDNAKANYEAFVKAFDDASKLVPEWTEDFHREPVEALGAELESGDPERFLPAVGAVAHTCHACHQQRMTAVHWKYHWPDFFAITVNDEVTGRELAYPELMQQLAAGLTGIGMNAAQGQPENARKQFDAFKSRFDTLAGMCGECHDSERTYYVDEEVEELITKLGDAISGDEIDMEQVGALSQQIGNESCFKCHLVHAPSALSKMKL